MLCVQLNSQRVLCPLAVRTQVYRGKDVFTRTGCTALARFGRFPPVRRGNSLFPTRVTTTRLPFPPRSGFSSARWAFSSWNCSDFHFFIANQKGDGKHGEPTIPRGALEGPNENGANRSPAKLSAVYLNGRQPGVKLLDRVRNALRVGQYALETEKAYVDWIKQYIRFHGTKHPEEMGAIEVDELYWTGNHGRSCRSADGKASGCRSF